MSKAEGRVFGEKESGLKDMRLINNQRRKLGCSSLYRNSILSTVIAKEGGEYKCQSSSSAFWY